MTDPEFRIAPREGVTLAKWASSPVIGSLTFTREGATRAWRLDKTPYRVSVVHLWLGDAWSVMAWGAQIKLADAIFQAEGETPSLALQSAAQSLASYAEVIKDFAMDLSDAAQKET